MTFPDARADADEAALYKRMLDQVAESDHPYPETRFSGRGIVICGGGEVYFTCAWVCIGMLRQLGCTLPVELWYRGPAEMNAAMIALVREMNVECVDAYAVSKEQPFRRLDSWELKPFAIAHSRFAEVLYLDADNVPVQNLDALFEWEAYRETGAVFWPDRYTGTNDAQEWLKRSAWNICGVPYRREPEIEAGQLLINKRRCWQPLMLTLHINENSDFYYAHFYGDKDTFRLAWHRLGRPYALVPYPVRNLGSSDAMVQHDLDGRVLFQHRNGDKWSVTKQPKRLRGFVGAEACAGLLAQLGKRWLPPLRQLPEMFTAVERSAYEQICGTRWYNYAREGSGVRQVELRPDFTVGSGAGPMEVRWMVEEDKDGQPVLSIRNANAPTCFLRRGEDESWRGRWRVYDRARVRLDASDMPEQAASKGGESLQSKTLDWLRSRLSARGASSRADGQPSARAS
jgi:hypothetical protein